VTATEAGFVATGRVETTDDSRAMAWTSRDGITWSSPVDLLDGEGADPRRIVVAPNATIIVGVRWLEDETTVGVAWSWTGGQWTTAVLPDTGPLAACGEAFVLLGSSGEELVPWTSRDGLTWERGTPSADPDAPGPGDSVLDTACAADRLLVMGWQGEDEHSVFWVSP
jgi:hypothetical protein